MPLTSIDEEKRTVHKEKLTFLTLVGLIILHLSLIAPGMVWHGAMMMAIKIICQTILVYYNYRIIQPRAYQGIE